jgi:hypothetical protein
MDSVQLSDAGSEAIASGSVRFSFGSTDASFVAHIERLLPFEFKYHVRPASSRRLAGNTSVSPEKPFHTIKTGVDLALKEHDARWYERFPMAKGKNHIPGKKRVPSDLVMTPTLALYWFLGDGYTEWTRQATATTGSCVVLGLCTNDFTQEDVQRLVDMLKAADPEMSFHAQNVTGVLVDVDPETGRERSRRRQIVSTAKSSSIRAFQKYIGACPPDLVKEMGYKWKVPTAQALPLYRDRDDYDEICEQIFMMSEMGDSDKAIARTLTDMGFPTARNKAAWADTTVALLRRRLGLRALVV